MGSKLPVFFAELKRRRVYRVAVIYVGIGVAISLGYAELYDVLLLPDWTPRLVIVLIAIGLPIALVLAWAYEVRPEEPRAVEPSEREASPSPGPTAPTATTAREQRKSIVVLPFDNMSPDPGDAYFSDGLTEEIITHLSYIRSLRVISRNSAMVLKGTQKSTRAIAEELDVQYVLEGSVRKAGDDLRITAQLIQAEEDEHLWAETYDGSMEDIFVIQEQTARSIVAALRLSLSTEEDQRLAERPIEDVQVYELYLLARLEIMTGTPEALERARRRLESGLKIFGENAALLQELAEVHLQSYETGVKTDEESLRRAEDLANRITSLQPNSAHGHYLKGRIERLRGSCTEATVHLERAVAIDPDHSSSLLFLFHHYALISGRTDLAAPFEKKVIGQDPLNPITWVCVGWYHLMLGDLEEASASFRKMGVVAGGIVSDWEAIFRAYVLIWQNRISEAIGLVDGVIERDTGEFHSEWAALLRKALTTEDVADSLSKESRLFLWNDPETVWLTASAFALSGQKEEALDWLEHAVDRGWINYPLFSGNDPLLESIRGEGRFTELMGRVKRDWEAFGAEREVRV